MPTFALQYDSSDVCMLLSSSKAVDYLKCKMITWTGAMRCPGGLLGTGPSWSSGFAGMDICLGSEVSPPRPYIGMTCVQYVPSQSTCERL